RISRGDKLQPRYAQAAGAAALIACGNSNLAVGWYRSSEFHVIAASSSVGTETSCIIERSCETCGLGPVAGQGSDTNVQIRRPAVHGAVHVNVTNGRGQVPEG